MADGKRKAMSLDAFLEWEAQEPSRYEYVDMQPVAMTGGSLAHDMVRLGVASSLRRQLRGKPCRATLDVKLVCPSGNVRYPDVAIDCGPYDPKSQVMQEARVAIEVLSPSTRATDLLVKLKDYASVPTIQWYIVFWQDEAKATVFRRSDDRAMGLGETFEGLDASITLPEFELSLDFAEIYEAPAA
jgi:Uma2 family endonuclease